MMSITSITYGGPGRVSIVFEIFEREILTRTLPTTEWVSGIINILTLMLLVANFANAK